MASNPLSTNDPGRALAIGLLIEAVEPFNSREIMRMVKALDGLKADHQAKRATPEPFPFALAGASGRGGGDDDEGRAGA